MVHDDKGRSRQAAGAFFRGVRGALPFVRTLILLTLISMLLAPETALADLESAVKAFNAGQRESAIAELRRLAEAGNTQAKYTLGIIYTRGQGIAPDYPQAVKWFQEAANEGYSSAQYSLGMLHAGGVGVPQDLVRGLMWLNIALEDRNSHNIFRLQVVSMAAVLKKSMTPEQIAEAEKLSSAWKAEKP